MAIEVTDEMRKAVYEADCKVHGHVFDFGRVVSSGADNGDHMIDVQSPDPDEMPNLSCYRCRKVWLVIEVPADNYDAAVENLKNKVKDPSTVLSRDEKKAQRGDKPGKKKVVDAQPHTH